MGSRSQLKPSGNWRGLRQLQTAAVGVCVALSLTLVLTPARAQGADTYVGAMMMTAASYCPYPEWREANGDPVLIAEYGALFALIGTTYGGDGINTMALPDLRGRIPRGVGQAPGQLAIVQGQFGGGEIRTLTPSQIPRHEHQTSVRVSSGAATHATPASNRVLAQSANMGAYVPAAGNSSSSVALGSADTPASAGGSEPISVRNPYLGIRWCIAVHGIFPPQN